MWQSRASHSRATGVVLIAVSGLLLATSYLTAYTLFEIASIGAFIFGVILIASEVEAKVKLIPSAESILGPLLAFSDSLVERGLNGKALYVPSEEGVLMQIGTEEEEGDPVSFVPVGRGLFESYERELGALNERGGAYVKTWIPRVLVDGLGIVEDAKFDATKEIWRAELRKPFVRPLCVRGDVNEKVCGKFGCPLVSSIGEALSSSLGKPVQHLGCSYDTLAETASAKYSIRNEE